VRGRTWGGVAMSRARENGRCVDWSTRSGREMEWRMRYVKMSKGMQCLKYRTRTD